LVPNEAGEYLPAGLAFKTREELLKNERIGDEIVQDAQAVTEPVERDIFMRLNVAQHLQHLFARHRLVRNCRRSRISVEAM
jgi:hypothetical protein